MRAAFAAARPQRARECRPPSLRRRGVAAISMMQGVRFCRWPRHRRAVQSIRALASAACASLLPLKRPPSPAQRSFSPDPRRPYGRTPAHHNAKATRHRRTLSPAARQLAAFSPLAHQHHASRATLFSGSRPRTPRLRPHRALFSPAQPDLRSPARVWLRSADARCLAPSDMPVSCHSQAYCSHVLSALLKLALVIS